MSRQQYTDTNSKETKDLVDHVCSIQTKRLHRKLVYSDEDKTVFAAETKLAMLLVHISFENLSTKKVCPDFKHLNNYLKTSQVFNDQLLARIIVAEAYNNELEDGITWGRASRNILAKERLIKQNVPVIL